MLPSVTLVFVRHGQQEAVDGAIGRQSPLSELGRRQAVALAAALAAGPKLAAVYSSPLPRAVETTGAICTRLSLTSTLEARLMEFELGVMPVEQLANRRDLLIWRAGDSGADGETLASFCRRVGDCCDEIAQRHLGERVAIVSHAGTIDAAVRWALDIAPERPWQHEVEVQHASITEIEFWPRGRIDGGSPRYAVMRRLNHTVHLEELASDL